MRIAATPAVSGAAAALAAAIAGCASPSPAGQAGVWKPVLSDEFNDTHAADIRPVTIKPWSGRG